MCAWECRHLCNAYIVHNIRIINIAHSKFQSWCLSVCTNTRFGFIVFFMCGFYVHIYLSLYIRMTSVLLHVYNCTTFLFIYLYASMCVLGYAYEVSVSVCFCTADVGGWMPVYVYNAWSFVFVFMLTWEPSIEPLLFLSAVRNRLSAAIWPFFNRCLRTGTATG